MGDIEIYFYGYKGSGFENCDPIQSNVFKGSHYF